ncbi:MAG: hypothetical protein UZ07_CHB004000419 [Chlorobi bacterium OLB7]|nr:MAG: hypothetical protein UZ07_CHB004000419 [Chlorobi bacterium OLB7]
MEQAIVGVHWRGAVGRKNLWHFTRTISVPPPWALRSIGDMHWQAMRDAHHVKNLGQMKSTSGRFGGAAPCGVRWIRSISLEFR